MTGKVDLGQRPGGAAIFAPDFFADDFEEFSNLVKGQDGDRAMRCVEWCWDPDPGDCTIQTDYAFLLRDGDTLTAVYDQHVEGIFHQEDWLRLLRVVGFEVEVVRRKLSEDEATGPYLNDFFLCRR